MSSRDKPAVWDQRGSTDMPVAIHLEADLPWPWPSYGVTPSHYLGAFFGPGSTAWGIDKEHIEDVRACILMSKYSGMRCGTWAIPVPQRSSSEPS